MSIKISMMTPGTYPIQDYVGLAQEIENYGFDELHIADDLIMRPAWPILTLIGQHTKHIKLGPAIVSPMMAHPVYHAANLVALDELTGGRAICGVGRGGLNPMVGLKKPKSTINMLREAVQLMRKVIAQDTSPFDGEYFHATPELVFHHKPVRDDIPIFIGTWGPKVSQLGGEVAIGTKADCVADPGYVTKLRDNVRIGAERVGRNPDNIEMIVGPLCSISEDREAAIRTMKELLAIYLPFLSPTKEEVGIDEEAIKKANAAYLAGDHEKAASFVPDEAVKSFSLTGTPEDVIPQVEALIDAGATNIAFGPPHGPNAMEAIRLLGEKVLPNIQR
ncbi:MAG: LLM class flavin-dependent oxidoreductase [Gammaproteobacteria bacterium]|jgi:5,10-methylenetetrahydromethanopterin reductase|nr:LLM class flavin-dependent oxidoreductase [Gammaproteobacteria bacterium]